MQLPETLRNLFARKPRQKPQSLMDRFEVTGLHDLSSTIEFRRDSAANLMTIFFVALALLLVVGMWFGTFSKQETMRGIVLGTKGGQRIVASVSGTVSGIWARQGDTVSSGQKLITIVPQQTAAGAQSLSESDLQALRQQKENATRQMAEIKALMERDERDLADFDASLETLSANLKAQERDIEAAVVEQQALVSKMQRYLKVGYATRDNVTLQEQARQDYSRKLAEVRLQIAQLSTTALERRRAVQQGNTASAGQLSELTRLVAELAARIERAKSAIATDIITVASGQVAAVTVREGSEVEVGDMVAAIGDPDAPIMIGMQAPSKTMGLLAIGQRVVLKYDAFPYKTFGVKYGRIVSISAQPTTLPREDEQQLAIADPNAAKAADRAPPQSKYLIEVEPEDKSIMAYGVERPILIGSTLTADVIVERRRLIDWVLDPILAMRGRT